MSSRHVGKFDFKWLCRVSGSEDHTAKVWDLRKRKALYTLPGHTSLVSQVRGLSFHCSCIIRVNTYCAEDLMLCIGEWLRSAHAEWQFCSLNAGEV